MVSHREWEGIAKGAPTAAAIKTYTLGEEPLTHIMSRTDTRTHRHTDKTTATQSTENLQAVTTHTHTHTHAYAHST